MTDTVNWFLRVDPDLDAELREVMEREERDLKVVVVRAVRQYIDRSKAEAKAAKAASKTQQVSA